MPIAQHTRDCFTVAVSLGPIIFLVASSKRHKLVYRKESEEKQNMVTRLSSVFSAGGSGIPMHWSPPALTSTPFLPCSNPASAEPQLHFFAAKWSEPNLVLSPKTLSIHKILPCDDVFVRCSHLLPSQP